MRSGRLTLVIYAVCALLVVEGLGWITWQALRYERREAEARAESEFQEKVRLALWRMDSLLIPVLTREDSRPYFHYRSFYAEAQAYNAMYQPFEPDAVLVPSPLLTEDPEFVRLHFEIGPEGKVTSPQAPEGNMRDEAEAHYVSSARVIAAERLLEELTSVVGESAPAMMPGRFRAEALSPSDDRSGLAEGAEGMETLERQELDDDFAARRRLAQESRAQRYEADSLEPAGSTAAGESEAMGLEAPGSGEPRSRRGRLNEIADALTVPRVVAEPMRATWLHVSDAVPSELALVRRVRVGQRHITQGVWLDWPAMRSRLREAIADLLPDAALLARHGQRAEDPTGRLLASVPVLLLPGPPPPATLPTVTPLRATLAVTWLAMLGAIAAIGLVLRASVRLAERRARFVSAVTHELRTPLTTFCLYTQMLSDGMVQEEAAKREYLGTLKRESKRLAEIVENVLEYARLGNRGARRRGTHKASAILERVAPTLAQRAGSAGLRLVVERGRGLEQAETAADPALVERVLYNLVDNACKYAAAAPDPRLRLRAGVEDGKLVFTVRDHGPGVPHAERRRLFEAFHRGPGRENGSVAGLGLGLALASGLAHELNGRLRFEEPEGPGAAFRLEVPLKDRRAGRGRR